MQAPASMRGKDLREATILLVEDNADDALLTRRTLRKNNILNDVVVARDGAEALEYLFATGRHERRDPDSMPHLVLLDLGLPKVGGLEILKTLNASNPDVPVIIITAHGTVDSAVEAIKLGAFDYITKPFDQTELSQVISKAVRTHAASQRSVKPDGSARAAKSSSDSSRT